MTELDALVTAWFHGHRQPLLTKFMWLITTWHSLAGVSVMAVGLAALLYRRRLMGWLCLLAISVPGVAALNAALKQVFHRLRPHFDDPLVLINSYSFPSGHTSAATVFYGFLVMFWLSSRCDFSLSRRLGIVAAAVLMVLLVAVSRVYLGAHYLSDVLFAMVEGLLWLGFGIALLRSRLSSPNEGPHAQR